MLIMLFIWLLIIGGIGYFFFALGEPVYLGLMAGAVYGTIPAIIAGGLLSVTIFGGAPMQREYAKYLVDMKEKVTDSPIFLKSDKSYYYYMTKNGKEVIDKNIFSVDIRYTSYGPAFIEFWNKSNDLLRIVGEEVPHYIIYLPKGSIILEV